jgi:hypothetical protein
MPTRHERIQPFLPDWDNFKLTRLPKAKALGYSRLVPSG